MNLIGDGDAILGDARWAREHGAEFVIVSIHWGTEYQVRPTAEQTDLAERLLASPDIDLILGPHVHVVQPIGRVNGEVVVYGMGNQLSNIQNTMGGCWPRHPGRGHRPLDGPEEIDGRFVVTAVEETPTWVDPATKRVLPVAWARAVGEGDAALLAASWERTTGYVTMLDTEGLAATPAVWPSLACAGRVAGLVGTTGPDLLIGTPGDDIITGRGGDDTIQGLDGNDLICGGPGDDTLWAGPGFDQLLGGDGDDALGRRPWWSTPSGAKPVMTTLSGWPTATTPVGTRGRRPAGRRLRRRPPRGRPRRRHPDSPPPSTRPSAPTGRTTGRISALLTPCP